MKKLITIGTAVVMTAVMCVSFAACGGSGNPADSIVSDKVTAEEWEAAFDEENFTNFKAEVSCYELTVEDGEKSIFNGKGTISVDGTNIYCNYTGTLLDDRTVEDSGDCYYDAETHKCYVNENGEWVYSINAVGQNALNLFYEAMEFAYTDFENVTYSNSEKGYVWHEGYKDAYTYIIKIIDGKVAAVIWYVSGELTSGGHTESTDATLSVILTYGGQKVNMPEIAE